MTDKQDTRRDLQVAWAAGLFEGEGCIRHRRDPSGRMARRLCLAMADKDVVRRFHEIVECGNVRLEPRPPNKDLYRWSVSNRADLERVLRSFIPYLGARRRAKAEELLADPAVAPEDRTHCKRGHPFSGENLYISPTTGARRCQACHRMRDRNRSRTKAAA